MNAKHSSTHRQQNARDKLHNEHRIDFGHSDEGVLVSFPRTISRFKPLQTSAQAVAGRK